MLKRGWRVPFVKSFEHRLCERHNEPVSKFTDEKFKVGCGTIERVEAWCKPKCKSHNPPQTSTHFGAETPSRTSCRLVRLPVTGTTIHTHYGLITNWTALNVRSTRSVCCSRLLHFAPIDPGGALRWLISRNVLTAKMRGVQLSFKCARSAHYQREVTVTTAQ